MIRKLDVNHMPKLITSPRAAFKKEVKHAELLTAQCTSRCLMAGMLDDDAEPDVDPEDGIALLAQLAGRAAPMTTPGGSGSTSGSGARGGSGARSGARCRGGRAVGGWGRSGSGQAPAPGGGSSVVPALGEGAPQAARAPLGPIA